MTQWRRGMLACKARTKSEIPQIERFQSKCGVPDDAVAMVSAVAVGTVRGHAITGLLIDGYPSGYAHSPFVDMWDANMWRPAVVAEEPADTALIARIRACKPARREVG